MDDIVRVQPNTTYASLAAAIALARGRRLALVFPAGERGCLRDEGLLDALRRRCRLLGKDAVIIGGDAWLRAHAVAMGFESATSLEDWGETTPAMIAVRPRRVRKDAPRLWLVAPRQSDTDISGEQETWLSEPPDYVVELREAFVGRSSAIRKPILSHAKEPAISIADDEDDDPITASERFEEMITGRILETSGLHHLAIPGTL